MPSKKEKERFEKAGIKRNDYVMLTFDDMVNVICIFELCKENSEKEHEIKEYVNAFFEQVGKKR